MPRGDYGRSLSNTDERSSVRTRAGRIQSPTEDITI